MALVEKKTRAYISSSFSVIASKYFGIFFMDLTLKNDKNPDPIKNSSLYKFELTITLSKRN